MRTNLLSVLAFSTLFVALPLQAGEAKVVRLSEPVEVTGTHEVFGAPLPEAGEPLSIGTLVENSDDYLDQAVVVETRIAKVCQKKGCFFVAQYGADTVRVSFADYSFFIPTDSGGKTVTLAGTFSRKPMDKAKAEHLAADLGESPPENPPAFEYAIVATSVAIPL